MKQTNRMQTLDVNIIILVIVVILVIIGVILLLFNTVKKYRGLKEEELIKLRNENLDKASTSIIIKLIIEFFAGK